MRPVTIIAAMSRNRVIGKDGGIPWKEPEDMKFFKVTTTGHIVIMGRKTWDSLGKWKPLPNRVNIVISRTMNAPTTPLADYIVVRSLGEALQVAEGITGDAGDPRIFVIGGAEIYREALPLADEVLLTIIDREIEGDTFFPELGPEWERTFRFVRNCPLQLNASQLTFDTYVKNHRGGQSE